MFDELTNETLIDDLSFDYMVFKLLRKHCTDEYKLWQSWIGV